MTILKRKQKPDTYETIPKLAKRLYVTPASVRDWIRRGYIKPPPTHPVTGERAYLTKTVKQIERWYMERAANGGTRGHRAAERRQRARVWLSARGIRVQNKKE